MSTFLHKREIAATAAEVFAAIADPSRLARWWGPEGFTNTFATFEFRPGGAWQFTMHGPDGKDYWNESVFVEIVPDELVRIRHVCLPLFEAVITLAATGAGTLVTWRGEFEDEVFAEQMRAFLESANEQNLDRLEREVDRVRG